MLLNCDVQPYSIELLKELIVKHPDASEREISNKLHLIYFEEYFSKLDAKTIVVETDYVDRDFLEDFAAYYVRCFYNYDRTCTRLHFFNHSFDGPSLDAYLENDREHLEYEDLRNSYLGFIVVKPLPFTIIGRTCLKTYDSNGNRRFYPTTRKYKIHLYGIPLQIKTIAFQEQDMVAAACATSALWSAFHKTGELFNHHIPSPVEITKSATRYSLPETRVFPGIGLTGEQMAQAVRDVSLEPFMVSVSNNPFLLKANVCAYLKAGIPAILGVYLFDISDPNHPVIEGKHAITVMGYNLSPSIHPYGGSKFRLKASCIDKIYAHDDQVGPFARLMFQPKPLKFTDKDGNIHNYNYFTTSWVGKNGVIGSIVAVPDILLFPLYHKIRIPFQTVLESVDSFNQIIEFMRTASSGLLPKDHLEWDIYLTTVSELKKDILDKSELLGEYRRILALESMPRFIWRADAYCQGEHTLDLLFDATDIELGQQFFKAIEYDSALSKGLRSFTPPQSIVDDYAYHGALQILERLTNS